MTFVLQLRVLPQSLWRPAIFFFAVAQIYLSFAPLLEGRQGPDARTHVEELGTTLHHAHDEADCAACTARGLLAASDLESLAPLTVASAGPVVPGEASLLLPGAGKDLSRSRGPPSV